MSRRRLIGIVAVLAAALAGTVATTAVRQAPPAAASPVGGSYQVYAAAGSSADRLFLSDLESDNLNPTPTGAGTSPSVVAITNDDKYVVVGGLNEVAVLGTGGGGQQVAVPGQVTAEAADPANDGLVYVAVEKSELLQSIYTVTITGTGATAAPFATVNFRDAVTTALAVTPDGSTLLVGRSDPNAVGLITAFSVSSKQAGAAWTVPGKNTPVDDLAVSPNGKELYVADGGSLIGLSLPLQASESTNINAGSAIEATSVTVSADGNDVYAAGSNGNEGAVVEGFLAGNPNAATTATVQGVFSIRSAVTVSPDGKYLITEFAGTAAGAAGQNSIVPVGLAAGSGAPGMNPLGAKPITPAAYPNAHMLATSPDQAPIAKFNATVQPAGQATSFDASVSTVQFGSVVSYKWNFGDGAGTTTTGPTVSHTYTQPGSFLATVTETDSAGTSVPPAFGGFAVDGAGQTASLNSSVLAEANATLNVTANGTPTTTPSGTNPTTTPTTAPTNTTPTTTPTNTTSQPVLVLNPTVGEPGTPVAVTGAGFPPSVPVTLSWASNADSNGPVDPLPVTVMTTGGGTLQASMIVLVPDVLGPRNAVAAGYPTAVAAFLVVPGTAEPGGDDANPLFRSEGP